MRHPYADHDTCVKRLLEWHARNGRIIVAYDFDNTVYDYHARGHDYGDVAQLIRDANAAGAYLIVFTGNQDTALVRAHLEAHNIPYHAINEQAPFIPNDARKIYYNLLLDDAAGLACACAHLRSYLDAMAQSAPHNHMED